MSNHKPDWIDLTNCTTPWCDGSCDECARAKERAANWPDEKEPEQPKGIMNAESTPTDKQYTATPQKGMPGHRHFAQVFKDGKAFLMIEPTEDEMEATRHANHVANCLNRIEAKRLINGRDELLAKVERLEKEKVELKTLLKNCGERLFKAI